MTAAAPTTAGKPPGGPPPAASPGDLPPPPAAVAVREPAGGQGVRGLVEDVRAVLGEAREGRFLAWRLFKRDLKVEFMESRLGWGWNFIDPILLAVVFVFLRGQNVIGGLPVDVSFPIWVVLGTLTLRAFLDGLSQPLLIVNRSRELRHQVPVSASALVLSQVIRLAFDAAFHVPVMLLVLLWYGHTALLGLAVGIALYGVTVLLGFGLGVVLIPLNAAYQDVSKAVSAMNRPLLFACPTFWYRPLTDGWLGWLSVSNPLAILMNESRLVAAGATGPASALPLLLGAGAVAAGLLLLGTVVLHRVLPLLNAKA